MTKEQIDTSEVLTDAIRRLNATFPLYSNDKLARVAYDCLWYKCFHLREKIWDNEKIDSPDIAFLEDITNALKTLED